MDIRALIIALVGVVLILVAGLFPHPLDTLSWVIGLIAAVIGAVLFIASLARGSNSRL